MGTLLYQWSTAAQLVSVLMIAAFFATLARSVRRYEVAAWAAGWWCNALALAVTVSFWSFAWPNAWRPVLRGAFVGSKATFAVLLVSGALAMRRPGARWMSVRMVALVAAVAIAAGVFILVTIDRIGIVVQGGMGVLLIGTGVMLLGRRRDTNWLAVGMLLRGVAALVEGISYYLDSLGTAALTPDRVTMLSMFIGVHSSIDLGLDWLLSLGGVLAIARRNQRELESTNTHLEVAQEELRRLADRDALTGLANRRALPDAFRAVFETGAALVFLDLDGFKEINDALGHAAGDECLVRFANALRSTFRPGDAIVRFGGDEFVVVAGGMSTQMADERIERLRSLVDVRFSAGSQLLHARADAEVALRAADESMYTQKHCAEAVRTP